MARTFKKLSFVLSGILFIFSSKNNCLAASSAETLPQGVRAGAFVVGGASGVQSQFNNSGRLESLVSPLNRSVGLSDLVAFEPELQKLRVALNSLGPDNLGESLVGVNLYQELSVAETRFVSALFWGVTNKFTLGVTVPYISRKVQAKFSAEVVNNGGALAKYVGSVPEVEKGLKQLESTALDTDTFSKAIFQKNGYMEPTGLEASGLGDIEFESRYRYFTGPRVGLQLRATLQAPTANHKTDIRNLLDRPLGSEDYSFKMTSIHEFKVWPGIFSISTSAYVKGFAEARLKRAVAKSTDQLLPDLNDSEQIEFVHRKRGYDFGADIGAVADLYGGVGTFSTSFVFSQHLKDNYWGDRSLDYARLMNNTGSQSQGLEFTFGLSSIPLFLKSIWPVPGKWSITWFQPIAGRKSMYTPYGRMDFVLLF